MRLAIFDKIQTKPFFRMYGSTIYFPLTSFQSFNTTSFRAADSYCRLNKLELFKEAFHISGVTSEGHLFSTVLVEPYGG